MNKQPSPTGDNGFNRRTDNDLRCAIDAIQELLFDPQAALKVFPLLLEHICAITSSKFGVIITSDADGINAITSAQTTPLNAWYAQGSRRAFDLTTVLAWVRQNQLPKRPVFFNQPLPAGYKSVLTKPEKITAMAIIPIRSHRKLRAVCVLAKRDDTYSAAAISRSTPLVGSAVCALQSADAVKNLDLDIQTEIADNRFLNTLLSTSPIAIVVVTRARTIAHCNPAARRMLAPELNSEDPRELERTSIETYLPEFEQMFQWSKQRNRISGLFAEDTPEVIEEQLARRRDGSEFFVNITVFRYTHGLERYTTLQLQDVSSVRANLEEFKEASQQLNALTHLVPVGIIRVDQNWCCQYANDKWFQFTGMTSEDVNDTGWIDAIHSDDVHGTLESLRDALIAGVDFKKELRLVSPLGQTLWVEFNTQVLFDSEGQVQGFLGTFADVTERLVHQERLRHVAEYDSLTGLANRHLFQDRLLQAFNQSERNGDALAVCYIDLDGFKDINDTMGHGAGDQLLTQVGQRLVDTLRSNDTIARFGGDEFVVLLSNSDQRPSYADVAGKIVSCLGHPYIIDGIDVVVTSSVGIATGNASNSSPERILKQADAALYLAKAEGKNGFRLFNDELDRQAQQRLYMTNQVRKATQNQTFYLEYQPQACVNTGAIVGYEALIRFKDEHRNKVSPVDFISILEDTGLIIPTGRWVIDEACKQLANWQRRGMFPDQATLSINVSAKQLLADSLIADIIDACSRHQVDPHRLVIEITETVLIDKPAVVLRTMTALKDLGVRFALDDFGTGYSSLTYLQRYPLDHIKIDKSFVADLLTDDNDAKITKSIIALAKSLNLKVTAEGVGSLATLELLRQHKTDYFQGFFLSPPLPPEQAVSLDTSRTDGFYQAG